MGRKWPDTRGAATGGSRYDTERFSAYLNAYTQQDSRTATGDLELTDNQRSQLANFGDGTGGIPILSLDTLDGRAANLAVGTRATLPYCVSRFSKLSAIEWFAGER